jgi:hypothetical protein
LQGVDTFDYSRRAFGGVHASRDLIFVSVAKANGSQTFWRRYTYTTIGQEVFSAATIGSLRLCGFAASLTRRGFSYERSAHFTA